MALKLFELSFSLKINAIESTINPVNVIKDRAKIIVYQWDISLQNLPISYLGTPLVGNPLTKSFQETTIDKVDKKLHGQRYNQISKGGKLTLINSSLSSTPNYLLSLLKAPTCVYKQIENSWRNFLWNCTITTRTRHLINWNLCITPRSNGGLGSQIIRDTNVAFFSKWIWRYYSEDIAMWKNLIEEKYQKKSIGDIPRDPKQSSKKAHQRSILKTLDWFESKLKCNLNNGENLSFWRSKWFGAYTLAKSYPRFFALSTQKICGMQIQTTGRPKQKRRFNDREENLQQSLTSSLPHPDINKAPDKPRWILNNSGFFSIASVKNALFEESIGLTGFPIRNLTINYKNLWESSIQKKCKFFLLMLSHGKLNTMDAIQKRNPNTSLSLNWCITCKMDVEDINHLFIHCKKAKKLCLP